MKALVASNQHGLLPFAWRLKKEGADVEVLVFNDKYEKAWGGLCDKIIQGHGKSRKRFEVLGEVAKDGGMAVLTDCPKGMKVFSQAKSLFGVLENSSEGKGPFALGAWFDGEKFILEHLLLQEWGLWPGGYGPEVLGGAILRRGATVLHQHFTTLVEPLRQNGFKGLVSIQVMFAEGGKPVLGRMEFGWRSIHTEAFISDLSSLSDLLEGKESFLEQTFVVAVPVTIPPYPIRPESYHAKETVVGGIGSEDTKNLFFHDFKTNGSHEVETAGLDGFVAVARGSSHSLDLARARALSLAAKIQIPEKQVRLDVGINSGLLLGQLGEFGFIGTDGVVKPNFPLNPTNNSPLVNEVGEGSIEVPRPTSEAASPAA